jgi:RNA polymerase sigma-70 factor (ECF subfamily)
MHPDLEQQIRHRFDAGDLRGACTVAIDGYGSELLSYLIAIMRDDSAASEAFSATCEAIWRELHNFEWRSSFRTWAYVLARHSASRSFRSPHRRPDHAIPLSQIPEVSAIIERVRTQTQPWLRTEVKDGVARLREKLSPDEQTLLILRVDRQMSWQDVARVLEPENADEGNATARIRKRFQRVKEKLRELAQSEQLIP